MISLLPLKPADQETVKVLDVALDISRLCGGSGLTVGLNRKYNDKNGLLQHFSHNEILVYIKPFSINHTKLPVMTNISLIPKKEEGRASLKKERNSAQQWCLSKMITLPKYRNQ